MTCKNALFLSVWSLACLGFLVHPLAAQTDTESGIVTDEDALFGATDDSSSEDPTPSLDESLFGEDADTGEPFIDEVDLAVDITSALLTTQGVELGGRYGFSVDSSWTWDPETIYDDFSNPEEESSVVDVNATLFFDARPSEDFRVFGKTTVSYPFDDQGGVREFDDVFHVDELFSDFTWKDRVYFRGGKHTINWGVGYFFSPADLLNITEINPEDPEAEREGPVSLKTHVPIDVHNLYLYLIANNIVAADEVGVAAKMEFVIGSLETGIGGLYQKDASPSGMLTVSFLIWDIDFFGEAVLRYGSDRTFIEETDENLLGVKAVTYDDTIFFNATAGFSFIYTFDEMDSSISAFGQYLYNGEGYENTAILTDNQAGVFALKENGDISFSDLLSPGLHYAAANVSWNSIFESDISLQGFWMHNFSDMSGSVSPSVSVELFDSIGLRAGIRYQYGEKGDEFSPFDDRLTAQLRLTLGGGNF